jgi:hypothetical protein
LWFIDPLSSLLVYEVLDVVLCEVVGDTLEHKEKVREDDELLAWFHALDDFEHLSDFCGASISFKEIIGDFLPGYFTSATSRYRSV